MIYLYLAGESARIQIIFLTDSHVVQQHFESTSHQDFAGNEENFAALDRMIASGPDLSQFLADTVRYHEEHMKQAQEEKSVTLWCFIKVYNLYRPHV